MGRIYLAPDQYGMNGTHLDLMHLACSSLLALRATQVHTGRARAIVCATYRAITFVYQCFMCKAKSIHFLSKTQLLSAHLVLHMVTATAFHVSVQLGAPSLSNLRSTLETLDFVLRE